jgi:hypothetical protein
VKAMASGARTKTHHRRRDMTDVRLVTEKTPESCRPGWVHDEPGREPEILETMMSKYVSLSPADHHALLIVQTESKWMLAILDRSNIS